MELMLSSGRADVDRALETLIGEVERMVPDVQLGWYLHGSAASGTVRTGSDVDVLAVAVDPISRHQRDFARQRADELARVLNVELDFHLVALEALINDPYVDLRRTGLFLHGVDVRPRLGEPTLDALAREAVLVMCIVATDKRGQEHLTWPLDHLNPHEAFYGRVEEGSLRGLAKDLTWISSARLAAHHGYAPVGAQDALEALGRHGDPYARWVQDTVRQCRAVDLESATGTERTQLQTMCHDALEYENDTFAKVHTAVRDQGRLGPACRKVLDTFITFP